MLRREAAGRQPLRQEQCLWCSTKVTSWHSQPSVAIQLLKPAQMYLHKNQFSNHSLQQGVPLHEGHHHAFAPK